MPRFFAGGGFLWILSRPVFTITEKGRRVFMKRRGRIWMLGVLSVVMFLCLSAQPVFAAEKTVKLLILDCG
jgi:hypothetical protein